MTVNGLDLALDHQDAKLLQELIGVWQSKRFRNVERTIYFEGKNALKDFGFAIPPKFHMAGTALGWIATGVTALTNRSDFQGFVSPDGLDDPFGLDRVRADNEFDLEFAQAKVSSAIHGCSFLTVSHGDVQSGEPDVLVLARAADTSGGLWSRRKRAVRGFLSVVEVDAQGSPSELVMYTPEKVVSLSKRSSSWAVEVQANPLKRVPVARLPYKPELNKPFGHSRITPASMAITDSAVRTVLRSEVQSELYAGPEYWLFNADMDAFGGDRWKALMGRIKGLQQDEDAPGDLDLKRFEGASPQPHTDQLRMLASLFAGEMDLALSSLGIVQDNPSSAEAIYAAKEDLIVDTGHANRWWGQGAVRAAQMAVQLRDGVEMSDELRRLSAAWTDPALTNPTAKADAFVKKSSAIPGYAETEVGLEDAGLSRTDIARYKAERQRAQLRESISALSAQVQPKSDVGV